MIKFSNNLEKTLCIRSNKSRNKIELIRYSHKTLHTNLSSKSLRFRASWYLLWLHVGLNGPKRSSLKLSSTTGKHRNSRDGPRREVLRPLAGCPRKELWAPGALCHSSHNVHLCSSHSPCWAPLTQRQACEAAQPWSRRVTATISSAK